MRLADDRAPLDTRVKAALAHDLGHELVGPLDPSELTPIHPIGFTHRKGRNNATVATAEDVGRPWAIGSKEGGHTAVVPALGTLTDFDASQTSARELGLEIALDYALQCSLRWNMVE